MRKLFLVALVVGVCTLAVMAQDPAKVGIYGGIQNLRFNAPTTVEQAPATVRQAPKQGSTSAAIYGGIQNLRFNAPATVEQDVNNLPQASKSTFFSTLPTGPDKQYVNNLYFNLPRAAGEAGSMVQCPPSCPGGDYNRVEIYGGYSLMSFDFRFFRIAGTTIGGITSGGFFGSGNFFDNGFDFFERRDRRHVNGGDASVTVNFSRFFGVQFDFSAYRRRPDDLNLVFLNDVAGNGIIDPIDSFILANISRPKLTIQNFLVGVQVKDNQEDGPWARPFGHLLLGASRQRLSFEDVTLISDFDGDGDIDTIFFDNDEDDNRFRRTSFALAIGGGLDLRVSDRISIRAFKFDYLPVFARPPVLFLDNTALPLTTIPGRPLFFLDDRGDRGDRVDRKTQHNFRIGAGLVVHF
jgi:opacity protein-like surface antigen